MILLGYIAVFLGYICVGVGFYVEFTEDGEDAGEKAFNAVFAVLWPLVLALRIGQWIADKP